MIIFSPLECQIYFRCLTREEVKTRSLRLQGLNLTPQILDNEDFRFPNLQDSWLPQVSPLFSHAHLEQTQNYQPFSPLFLSMNDPRG
jgi:hypothetical protein